VATGEDTADWEDSVCTVVNYRVCELLIVPQLRVVTSCMYKSPINQLPIQTLSTATHTHDNIFEESCGKC
jgi:hypothetical protein